MGSSKKLSDRVLGCAQNVSRELGAGFLEKVYENALCIELTNAGIPFLCQRRLDVYYKDEKVGSYIADFVVDNKLLVELKALSSFNSEHEAQVLNYLKASGLSVGLLLNFGVKRMGIRRLVWNYDDTRII